MAYSPSRDAGRRRRRRSGSDSLDSDRHSPYRRRRRRRDDDGSSEDGESVSVDRRGQRPTTSHQSKRAEDQSLGHVGDDIDEEQDDQQSQAKPILPWGMQGIQQSSLQTMSSSKLERFKTGSQVKSRLQRQREEEEQKKLKADQEAKAALADFEKSFAVDESSGEGGTTFVSSQTQAKKTIAPKSKGLFGSFSLKGAKLVKKAQPSTPVSAGNQGKGSATKPPAAKEEALDFGFEAEEDVNPLPAKTKKSRQADDLLEELKRNAEEREKQPKRPRTPTPEREAAMMAQKDKLGVDTDGASCNLYVNNIALEANEEVLMKAFGPYGPIASVKIMWPRGEQVGRMTKMPGFVNFMRRVDAENALRRVEGMVIMGSPIRCGWGKKMDKQPDPYYVVNTGDEAENAKLYEGTSIPTDDSPVPENTVWVMWPSDEVRRRIDVTAESVAQLGGEFEAYLLSKLEKQPRSMQDKYGDLQYLKDSDSVDGIYYKWRVYSLMQGDSMENWGLKPFRMTVGGCLWLPPTSDPPAASSRQAVDGSVNNKTNSIAGSRTARRLRKDLPPLLDTLSMERYVVAEGMLMAMNYSENSKLFVELVVQHFKDPKCPTAQMVAILYLVSDILHNMMAPVRMASSYRSLFLTELPGMFEHLSGRLKSIEGRITANWFVEKVTSVVRVWEVWSIFPPQSLTAWRSSVQLTSVTASGPDASSGSQISGVSASAADSDSDSDVDGIVLPPAALQAAKTAAANAQAEATDCNGDGNSDSDSDVDGVPLA